MQRTNNNYMIESLQLQMIETAEVFELNWDNQH